MPFGLSYKSSTTVEGLTCVAGEALFMKLTKAKQYGHLLVSESISQHSADRSVQLAELCNLSQHVAHLLHQHYYPLIICLSN